jgi:hypothetical protein
MVVVMTVTVFVMVVVLHVNVELHAVDAGLLSAADVQVITAEIEFPQFAFEIANIHPQINQRADKHVAADAAEEIEVQGFHAENFLATDEHR